MMTQFSCLNIYFLGPGRFLTLVWQLFYFNAIVKVLNKDLFEGYVCLFSTWTSEQA